MKEFVVNPLNVLEMRRMDFLPPHFEPIEVFHRYHSNEIIDWIFRNLKGRFFYGQTTKIIDGTIINYNAVAFEDGKETTIFLLGCPHLAKNKIEY